MPSAKSLIGVGVPAAQANALGCTVSSKTAAGTTQGAATLLTTSLSIVTSAGGADAVRLPATAIGDGPYIVAAISATTVQVFPPTGGTLQGGSTDAAFNVAQNKTAMFFKTTATAWVVNLSA